MSRYIDAEWLKAEFPHNEDWKDQMWTEAVEASKTEPQTLDDIGKQIQDAYDKGIISDADATQAWYEAVNKTEPQIDCRRCKHYATGKCKECFGHELFTDSGYATDCSWKKGE